MTKEKPSSESSQLAKALMLELAGETATVWAYIPAKNGGAAAALFPTLWYPVVQSYVDVVLAGCAAYSQEFALEFLATTYGWGLQSGSWVDDRSQCRYSGHLVSAAATSEIWDGMQQQRRPLAFSCRGIRKRVDSAAQLDEDDEDDDDDDDSDEDDEMDGGGAAARSGKKGGLVERARRRSVEVFSPKGVGLLEEAGATEGGEPAGEPVEPEPVELPKKEGMVRVQEGKGWKDMLFCVEEGGLAIYAGQDKGTALAAMPCELCLCSDPKSTRDDAPFAFRIDVDTGKSASQTGWMTKQGEHRKNWKRRWFQIQLQGTELAYYEKSPADGGKSKGSIDLTKCQSVRTHDEDVLIVQLLAMTDDGKYREFLFKCDNEDDCMIWVSHCLCTVFPLPSAFVAKTAPYFTVIRSTRCRNASPRVWRPSSRTPAAG